MWVRSGRECGRNVGRFLDLLTTSLCIRSTWLKFLGTYSDKKQHILANFDLKGCVCNWGAELAHPVTSTGNNSLSLATYIYFIP